MERKINLLFGMIAGIFLVGLRFGSILSFAIPFRGFVIDIIVGILSIAGMILSIVFCILLLIDVIRDVFKSYKK